MTEQVENESIENRAVEDPSVAGPKKWYAHWKRFVFAGIATGLLAYSFVMVSARRAAEDRLEKLRDRFEKLAATSRSIDSYQRTLKQTQDTVVDTLKVARVPGDIPPFNTQRIVAHSTMEGFNLWVPQGEHTLLVTSWWHADTGQSSWLAPPSSVETKQHKWAVPLASPGGYMFRVKRERKGGDMTWTLQSGVEQFTTRVERLPIEDFSGGGSSSGLDETFMFPNQVSESWNPKHPIPTGVRVFATSYSGKIGEDPYLVTIQAELQTKSPACVSIHGAERMIILGMQDRLLPFERGEIFTLAPIAGQDSP